MRHNLILDLSLRVDNPSVTCSNVSYLTRQLDRFVAGSVAENGEEVSGGVVSVTRLADPERHRLFFAVGGRPVDVMCWMGNSVPVNGASVAREGQNTFF